jgi:L-fuconolactonase
MQPSDWLAQVQEPIENPALPIVDPHHHLWDHAGSRYLLDELLADVQSGHNVVATVFVECASMYRADGPEALRPVGETEFVNGIAAMSASGGYGAVRACAGIVSYADLMLGADVGAVLDAHMGASQRFRGIRHAAGWDADDRVATRTPIRRADCCSTRRSGRDSRNSAGAACRSTRGSIIHRYPS